MMTRTDFLRLLALYRTDEIVVTTMGCARPWGDFSQHELDFASVGSAMGHAADFALGLALARPERKVIVLNGDGSMLMCLGTFATIAQTPAPNLLLFIVQNGTYEVTGNQPLPAAPHLDFAQMARGCGLTHAYEFAEVKDLEAALPRLLTEGGPIVATVKIEPAEEPPPVRGPHNTAPYLQRPLGEDAQRLRAALVPVPSLRSP